MTEQPAGHPERTDWTRRQVIATVRDYLDMLRSELAGVAYSKAAHRRALAPELEGRTPGAIERKHQNISAVLAEMDLPFITGYKPLGNYQGLLADVVRESVEAGRFPSQSPSRTGKSPRTREGFVPAITIRVQLDTDGAAALRRPVNGSGGFQTLLRRLQDSLGSDDALTLSPELAARIATYVDEYGVGGFQDRLGQALVALGELSAVLQPLGETGRRGDRK